MTEEIAEETIKEKTLLTDEEIQKMLSSCEYTATMLDWKNFLKEPPEKDRYFVLWCPLGMIACNFIISYRDAAGNYDLPHPTKKYNAMAWAYIEAPTQVFK